MPQIHKLISLFERLAGEKTHTEQTNIPNFNLFDNPDNVLGYSQFNEILLLLGFNRINVDFFQFIVDGQIKYILGASIDSLSQLEKGIDRFVEYALLNKGNIKTCFDQTSKNPSELINNISKSRPVDLEIYKNRHNPIIEIDTIPADKTYFLGYYIEQELEERLKNKSDTEATKLKKEREKYIKIGIKNQLAYLSSDNLDVYVATSMRRQHEFIFVNELINKIFTNSEIEELKVRWFDPTQAYCKDRIDKGLSEALMLKRARCTLYLAQESETLGKDSELASTLAQGKPVIAYIPEGNKEYVDNLIENLKKYNNKSEKEIILDQIQVFDSSLAWSNEKVIAWVKNLEKVNLSELKQFFYNLVKKYYDKRAKGLKKDHPLGIQVNLSSGVANGVLVVRNIKDVLNL